MEVDAGGHDRRIALGREDAGIHIAGHDALRDRQRHVDLARLFDDGGHLVLEHLQIDVVQA